MEIFRVSWHIGKANRLLSRYKYFKSKEKAEDFAQELRLAWIKLEGIHTDFMVNVEPHLLES